MRAPLVAALVLVAAGCGGGGTAPSGDVDGDLERARAERPELYWAGPSIAGLELTAISPKDSFLYGTCELPEGEGGCAPPVQVQQFAFAAAAWRRASGCRGLPPIRGVPAARHDGLVLFTGARVLKVYARSRAEERRVALALRRLDGGGAGAPLPPPTQALRRLVARVCS